jgi:hypothetical protein
VGHERGEITRLSEAADSPFLQKMVKQADADHLPAMIDRCLEADVQIDRNVQLVLVLEALVDSLAAEPVARALRSWSRNRLQEHARTIEPARQLGAGLLALERQISDLVNAAYGLTPEEVALMWKTAPPRMPAAVTP